MRDKLAVVYDGDSRLVAGRVWRYEMIVGRGCVSSCVEMVPVTGRETVTGLRSEYIPSAPVVPSWFRCVGVPGSDEPVLDELYVESMDE